MMQNSIIQGVEVSSAEQYPKLAWKPCNSQVSCPPPAFLQHYMRISFGLSLEFLLASSPVTPDQNQKMQHMKN